MEYTVEYFINKFSAIPEAEWTRATFNDGQGRKCVMGHCGYTNHDLRTREGKELLKLMKQNLGFSPIIVNDAHCMYANSTDFGDTPKERILNALIMIAAGVTLENL